MSSTPFLKVCDVSKDPEHVILEPAIDYTFPLDPFQKHAVSAIDQGHNLLVCAKTGSGKTLCAEYQIAHSLRKGGRVFYTTPIKSLSNQKFHDLKQLYPKTNQVGIMTGDIKFCPGAQIVIMTTEILRNLLYKRGSKTENIGLTSSLSINGLDAVIFDECHYINDRDRGHVWEETMILLPPAVKMVLLSATLDRPDLFASWLGELKQTPIHLIQTQYRIVPLKHTVILGKQPQTIMDAKEVFDDQAYKRWLTSASASQKEREAYERKVKEARRAGLEGRIEGKVTIASFRHQLNEVVDTLATQQLLPALAFLFSRKDCELYAKMIESDLLDSSDSCLAERIFDFHLRNHKENLETIPQYHALRRLIIKGIAFHHSGLLPVLKEALEILFSKGLIKLLFCTETFAVGLNMPTKTVMFLSLSKYDDATSGMRLLRTDEYTQMAGRAGRRGKDTFGTVIYLPRDEPPSLPEMRMILKGGRPQIQSRMEFHYDFLLKTLQEASESKKWLEILEQSYWYRQHKANLHQAEKELEEARANEAKVRLSEDILKELEKRDELRQRASQTSNAEKRKAQKALEEWNNTHIGPKWFNADASWKTWRSALDTVKVLEYEVTGLKEFQHPVEKCLLALKVFGFIDETNQLTTKGVLASECNECHALLSAELYLRGVHKHLTAEELVCVLASMIADKESDEEVSVDQLQVPDAVKKGLNSLDILVADFQTKEDSIGYASPSRYWSLSTLWVEPAYRWLQGDSIAQICTEFGTFEGNMVRTVLRLANCVEEWVTMATYCEDVELLQSLESLRGKLIRDVVVPDSLYLHL